MPEFDALASQYQGKLTMLKLNSDNYPDIAVRYGVMGLPTIKMFCQGRSIGEIIGYMPGPRLKAELDRILLNNRECLESSSPVRA
jgi:thioredoxin-like negative regulator of GroEL